MQNDNVEFERVCNLQLGDIFLQNGRWRQVHKIINERIYYFLKDNPKNKRDSHPKNSQQIFQVVKKENVERC